MDWDKNVADKPQLNLGILQIIRVKQTVNSLLIVALLKLQNSFTVSEKNTVLHSSTYVKRSHFFWIVISKMYSIFRYYVNSAAVFPL